MRVEDQCKWKFLAQKAKSQGISVKSLRPIDIDDGKEGDKWVLTKSLEFGHDP
jgi:hypothetical protein